MKALAIALLGLAACWTPASAQRPGAAPAAAARETLTAGPRAPSPEMERRLEEFRRRRLEQALGIDSARAEAIEAELQRFRDRQLDLRGERARLVEELQRSLDVSGGDEAALQRRLDALRQNQEERERALSELRERLARDLTLKQQAKLQLFAERFQSRLAEGLRNIEDRRRRLQPGARPSGLDHLPSGGDSTDDQQPDR